MPVNNIFHDHIVLSNVDKHGVKQILYPKTTSSDVVMGDGNTTLANFLNSVIRDDGSVTMKQHLKFREVGQGGRPGLVMYDNNNNEFVAMVHNKTNLWIGAQSGTSGSHKGGTYISTGWDPSTNTAYPTIKVSVPKVEENINGADNYDVLHTGNIGDRSITFSNYSKGIFLHDTTRNYAGVYNNGDNLWIGAASGTSYHHLGKTYISAGFKPGDDWGYTNKYIDNEWTCIGNNTIYVSVPTANAGVWQTDTDPQYDDLELTPANYAVIHEGVLNDILDKNNLDLSNRYIGYHLAGHLAGAMYDSVFMNKVPIKDLSNSTQGYPNPYANVTVSDEGDLDTDKNGVDKYGRIKVDLTDEPPTQAGRKVSIAFNYDTTYYKYDVFALEIYDLPSVYYNDNLSLSITLYDDHGSSISHSSHITNPSTTIADGCLKFDKLAVGQGETYDDTVILLPSDYNIRRVEVEFYVTADMPTAHDFYVQTYAGHSIKYISHLRSYNHMLVDILARLYRLEHPSS